MQLDRVYQILAKVGVDADLKLEAPSGGLVQLRTEPATGVVKIRCSQADAVWDLFQLGSSLGTTKIRLRNLRRLRSPLVQPVEVSIEDKLLLRWEPGHYPRVKSLRTLLRVLRER